MTFAITTPADPAADDRIDNACFWPAIEPAQIRESQRIDGTITAPRLRDALIEAMAAVNAELDAWRMQQLVAGHETLADVPADEIGGASILVHRYLRAVGCLAKANLIERYRDYDSTARAERKVVQSEHKGEEHPADDMRRDARWAISDILGIRRTTVELL